MFGPEPPRDRDAKIRRILTQRDAEELVQDYWKSSLSGCPNTSLRSLELIQHAAASVKS